MEKTISDNKLIPQNKNISSLYMEPQNLKSFKLDVNEKNPLTSMEWGKKGKHNGYWQDTGDINPSGNVGHSKEWMIVPRIIGHIQQEKTI